MNCDQSISLSRSCDNPIRAIIAHMPEEESSNSIPSFIKNKIQKNKLFKKHTPLILKGLYFKPICYLFMVRFPPINPKSPINLLYQHQSHQLMWKRHFRKRQFLISPLQNIITESERSTDDEGDFAFAVSGEFVEGVGEFLGGFHFALDGEGDDVVVRGDLGEDALAFFVFDLLHFGVAEDFGGFFIGELDDVDFGVGPESFGVFGDSLLQVFFFQFTDGDDSDVHGLSTLSLQTDYKHIIHRNYPHIHKTHPYVVGEY